MDLNKTIEMLGNLAGFMNDVKLKFYQNQYYNNVIKNEFTYITEEFINYCVNFQQSDIGEITIKATTHPYLMRSYRKFITWLAKLKYYDNAIIIREIKDDLTQDYFYSIIYFLTNVIEYLEYNLFDNDKETIKKARLTD